MAGEDAKACERFVERVQLLRADSDDLGVLLATIAIAPNRRLILEGERGALLRLLSMVDEMREVRAGRLSRLRQLDNPEVNV